MQALRALKGLLWFVAAYQFVVGAMLLITPELGQLVVGLFGSNVEVTEQFSFMLKPIGAYMIMTGLISASAARAAVPHPSIVAGLVVLFSISVLYRVFRFGYIQSTFGIPAWHLAGQVVILGGLAIALTVLSRSVMRSVESS